MKTDSQMQRDVLDELEWEPSIEAAQIGVTVHEGMVTLTGHVPTYAEKHSAEVAAKRVHGVRAVANELQVRPSDVHIRDDEDIASTLIHAFTWDSKIPDQRIQVTVEQGNVTVEGTVDFQFQKTEVDRVVRHLIGVCGYSNLIVVAPSQERGAIEQDIEAALRRSATVNPKRVTVAVDGETVTLTGDVHSHVELEEAERIAWAGRGVRRVQNCMTITPWGVGPAEEWGY